MSQATTFAFQFTAFNKLLVNFQPNSQIHNSQFKEIIKEKSGSETSTDYFLALMETIENVKENSSKSLALLNMGIK
jgi:ribosomal RNA-processing protein 12